MHSHRLIFLIALLGVACYSTTALAERPAKGRELAEIAQALNLPAQCATAKVSTVNPNYATVSFKLHGPQSCEKHAANFGPGLVKLIGKHWKAIFTASCCFRCTNVPAPLPVKLDLKIPTCVAVKARRVDMVARLAISSARLTGPSTARLGSQVTFSATGVPSGTYTMRLVYIAIPDHVVVGTSCTAKIGVASANSEGHVRITGKLPGRLACQSGAGPVEGYYTTRPGTHYLITMSRNKAGMPFGGDPFLKHPLRVTA